MTTISVPISSEQEKFIKDYIASGKAENKAQLFRRALKEFEENQLLEELIRIEREPDLKGDLRKLVKKFSK